jgi:hypothetical protein
MEITASHHFDRTLADVWASYLDPDAHLARNAHMGYSNIELLTVERGDDTLAISIGRDVEVEVPSIARKVLHPKNHITSTDRWWRGAEGTCRGTSTLDIRGLPVESSAVATFEPDADGTGCTYTLVLTMRITVPVVGERVARALRGQLVEQLEAEFAAAEAWLRDH